MLVEAVGGWLTNSLALLSDAGHMFSDAFSLGMALWAFKLGEKQTTLQKTFGYKRFEILTAMFNGLSLVLIAAMIFYEAVKRLFYPPEILTGGMLVVSIIGLLVNIGVAVYMLKNSDTEENVNMRGAYLHVISDLFGSIGAIVAAVLIMAYGWQWADTVASVLVAALVGRSGWTLFKQTLHILMEGAPENIHTNELLSVIRNTEGVKSVHDLHVWTITSNIHVLSCHIVVDGGMTVAESEQIAYRIEHELAHHNIGHCTIQIESALDLGGALNTVLRRHGLPEKSMDEIRPQASHGASGLLKLGAGITPEHPDYMQWRKEFLDEYSRCYADQTILFDGVNEMLEALVQRGIQWGIITNKPMRFTDVLVPKLGFTVSPAVIVSGDTCDEPKPSVKPMFYACEQMGVEAQRCFYVGDAERDMQAGKNAGMTTVLADWGYISTEDQTENWFADFRIATPLDLLAILR